jgi:hypothetical protein
MALALSRLPPCLDQVHEFPYLGCPDIIVGHRPAQRTAGAGFLGYFRRHAGPGRAVARSAPSWAILASYFSASWPDAYSAASVE